MRVIGGSARGRDIIAPKGKQTRPMTDRTRESLFNILGDITGFEVLDAYAGSGAVGIEALSRGSRHVDAIEKNHQSATAISKNVTKIGFTASYKLYTQTVEQWLKSHSQNKQAGYDLIFCCPPHELFSAEILQQLAGLLKPNGILVAEHFFKEQVPVLDNLEFIRTASYGESALSIYRKMLP